MVYGGTIRPGSCEGAPQLDLVSAFQSYGKYLQAGKTEEAERERYNTVRHACPGPGACGGVSICAYIYRAYAVLSVLMADVHCEHNGERCRSYGDDPDWILILPCRVP